MLLCDVVNSIDVLDNRNTSQPHTNPMSRHYHYLHFAEEETEAAGDYVTCPRSCSKRTGIPSGVSVFLSRIPHCLSLQDMVSPQGPLHMFSRQNRICPMRAET